MTKSRALLTVALVTGLLVPSSAHAQQTRWQVTASLVTGGFASNLLTAGFDAEVDFRQIAGGISQKTQVTVNEDYSFDSFTGLGATAEWRRGRLGLAGNLTWIPTRAAAIDTAGRIPASAARAYQFDVPDGMPADQLFGPVPIRLKTSQDLVLTQLTATVYSAEVPQPGRPAEPVEYYGTAGIGLVHYLNDEPLLTRAGEDWGTPFTFSVGAGLFVNFTSSIGLRVDLRGNFWSTEILGESQTQKMIQFSPGFVFIR